MSQFETDFIDRANPNLATHFGKAITHTKVGDRREKQTATTITDATVIDRTDTGITDENGTFFARALEIYIPQTSLAAVAENDLITKGGEDWSIVSIRSVLGNWILIATRPGRKTVSASDAPRTTRQIAQRT